MTPGAGVAARRWAQAKRDPNVGGFPYREPSWRGATAEVYPETLAHFDLENEAESYESLLDETDEMPPTLAHRTMGIADRMAAEAFGPETFGELRRGVKPKSDRSLTSLKGLQPVEALVLHHGVRAAEYGVESAFTIEDWMRIRASFQGLCAYCGTNTGTRLTIEHVVAMVYGGPNTPANIVAACGPCNVSKNKKPLLDWLEKRKLDPEAVFRRINEAVARQRGAT